MRSITYTLLNHISAFFRYVLAIKYNQLLHSVKFVSFNPFYSSSILSQDKTLLVYLKLPIQVNNFWVIQRLIFFEGKLIIIIKKNKKILFVVIRLSIFWVFTLREQSWQSWKPSPGLKLTSGRVKRFIFLLFS
jgi:hypothetical protein